MDKRIGKRHWLVKNLTWVEDKGWEGIVYAYVLDAPNDKKNGWMYIGCTPEERIRHQSWSRTGNKYAGKKIADARKKYGTGSFSFIVLERHHDPNIDKLVEKLEERETAYINRFDTVKNGFNACRGGTGRRGQKISQNEIDRRNRRRRINGFKQSDEAKRKISLASSKRKKSQEEKDKISKANKGKKRTPEMRKAQSDRMKGKVPTAATEAAKEWVKQNGGGYWKGKQMPEEAKAKSKAAQQARGTAVRVYFPDGHIEDFPTMLDASKKTGDGTGSVKYSVEHGSTTKRGYRYEMIPKP